MTEHTTITECFGQTTRVAYECIDVQNGLGDVCLRAVLGEANTQVAAGILACRMVTQLTDRAAALCRRCGQESFVDLASIAQSPSKK